MGRSPLGFYNAGLPTAPAFAHKLHRAPPLWFNMNSPSDETYKGDESSGGLDGLMA